MASSIGAISLQVEAAFEFPDTPGGRALLERSRRISEVVRFICDNPPQRPRSLKEIEAMSPEEKQTLYQKGEAVRADCQRRWSSASDGETLPLKSKSSPFPVVINTPKLDPVASFVPMKSEEAPLSPKSTPSEVSDVGKDGMRQISYGKASYSICRTRADGACALHALLGENVNNEYVYKTKQEARQLYCEKVIPIYRTSKPLQSSLYDGLQSFLKGSADRNMAMVFSQTPQIIQPLQSLKICVQLDFQTIKEAQEKAYEQVFQLQESGIQEKVAKAAGCSWGELLANGKRQVILQNNLNKVLEALGNHPLAAFLTHARQQLNKLFTQEQELITQCMMREDVAIAYFRACMDDSYYFALEELHVMALVFNRQVTLFISGQEKPVIYNPNAALENVVIHYEGAHYSRCIQIL